MPRVGASAESIVSTAVTVADRDGYDAVSLSAIARELGVRPPSLYAHVSGKAELLSRLHQRSLGNLADLIAEATAGKSQQAALHGLVQAHRALAFAHPGMWEAMQRSADAETVQSDEAARVARLMTATLHGYDIEGERAVHAVRFVAATITGLLTLEGSGAVEHRAPDLETSWQNTVSAMDRALSSWPK